MAPKKMQATLAQSWGRNSQRAAVSAQRGTAAKYEVRESAPDCVDEQHWTSLKSTYDGSGTGYTSGSPLIFAGSEEGGDSASKEAGPVASTSTIVTRKNQKQASSLMLATQTALPELRGVQWEGRGLHFVSAIELLLAPHRPLSITLQEILVHMVINHGEHETDLSRRALRLLMRNAKHHPLSKRGPGNSVLANKFLWTPAMQFEFRETPRPVLLSCKSKKDVYMLYLRMWDHALQYCSPNPESPSSQYNFSPGILLVLQYCHHLIHSDLDVHLTMMGEELARGSGANQAWVVERCLLWNMLQLPGNESRHTWLTGQIHVALVRRIVATLLAARDYQPPTDATARVAAQSGGGRTVAGQHVIEPGLVAQAGQVAAGALRDLARLCYEAEGLLGQLYRKNDHKGTDCYYMCKELLDLLTGTAKGDDQVTQPVITALKRPGAKLYVLSVLPPEVRLRVLAMHLVEKIDRRWDGQSYTLQPHLEEVRQYMLEGGMTLQPKVDPLQLLSNLIPTTSTTPSQDSPPVPPSPAPPRDRSLTPPPPSQSPMPDRTTTPAGGAARPGAGGGGGGGGGGGVQGASQPGAGSSPTPMEEDAAPSTGRAAKRTKRATATSAELTAAQLMDLASKKLFRVSVSSSDRSGFLVWITSLLTCVSDMSGTGSVRAGTTTKTANTRQPDQQVTVPEVLSRMEARMKEDPSTWSCMGDEEPMWALHAARMAVATR